MPDTLTAIEQQSIALELSSVRSSLLLVAWTIDAINEEDLPESKKRFELFEGTSFILDTLAEKIAGVYRSMNVE